MINVKEKNQEKAGMTCLLLNVLLAGIFPVIGKLALNKLDPITVLVYGTFFAAIYFALIVTLKREWYQLKSIESKVDFFWAVVIIGFLYQLFYFWGLNKTSAGNAAIIALAETFFSYLFFHIWKKENFSLIATIGAIFIILGVSVILSPNFDGFHLGDIFILSAAAVAPLGNYFQRKVREKTSGNILMLARSFFSFLVFLLIHISFPVYKSGTDVIKMLPLLLINGILMLGIMKSLWIEAIHSVNVIKANAVGSISPIITLVIIWLFMNAAPTRSQVLSLIPIIAGLLIINHKHRQLKIV